MLQHMVQIVHIGLPKCGSTTLQELWLHSENCEYFNINGFVERVNQALLQSNGDTDKVSSEILNINLPAPDHVTTKDQIFSSEGVTYNAFDGGASHLNLLRRQLQAWRLSLISSRLLLIVRNPIHFLKSSHAQQIKQGGYALSHEFFEEKKEKLLHILNLRALISDYEMLGFDVVILPLELLARDPAKFWNEYEIRLGGQRPDCFDMELDERSRNTTNKRTLSTHATLNRLISHLIAAVERNDTVLGRELEAVLQSLKLTQQWGTRFALAHVEDDLLKEIDKCLALPKNYVDFEPLSSDYSEAIAKNFLQPLADKLLFPYEDILAEYKQALAV